jgi:hypothetical protein
MPNWLKGTLIALAFAGAALALSQMMREPVEGQTPDSTVLRTPDGKPDLNGIWQSIGTANWNLQDHPARTGPVLELGAVMAIPAGVSVVEGNEIPYQPWAAAKQKENYDNWMTRDPEVKCYLPGVPRATYMPFPFQIIQSSAATFITYEYAGAVRHIYAKDPGPPQIDSWMGMSYSTWEGDTFVVHTSGFNDQSWFDRAGNHHSEQMKVTERYTMTDADHINYSATIEDPVTFTRPWTMSMPLYRRVERNAQLGQFKCVEFVTELMYGQLRKEPVK